MPQQPQTAALTSFPPLTVSNIASLLSVKHPEKPKSNLSNHLVVLVGTSLTPFWEKLVYSEMPASLVMSVKSDRPIMTLVSLTSTDLKSLMACPSYETTWPNITHIFVSCLETPPCAQLRVKN